MLAAKRPAAHAEHALDLGIAEKPSGHRLHVAASVPECQPPGQSVQIDCLLSEYVEASQIQHSPMPGDGENLPSGHEVQAGEPTKENSPATHVVSHVAAPALLAFPWPLSLIHI